MKKIKSQNIQEIGLSKYYPFVIRKKDFKEFIAEFNIDPKTVSVEDRDGRPVTLSDVDDMESLTYTVSVKSGNLGSLIPIDRDGVRDSIKVLCSVVTFKNNMSSMANLKGNIGIMIFSTVSKVLSEFQKTYPQKFQCFHFTPAHNKLVGVYEILSRESEKQGNLIYANKNSGKERHSWYLLNTKIWKKYKEIRNIN